MPCVFRIAGKSLDLSRLLGEITLRPYRTWLIDTPRVPGNPKSKDNVDSGACFDASKAEMNAFDTQVSDATQFLKEHKADLGTILSFPGLDYAVLDFGIELRPVFIHSDYLPTDFLQAAASAGVSVELSHYPKSDES